MKARVFFVLFLIIGSGIFCSVWANISDSHLQKDLGEEVNVKNREDKPSLTAHDYRTINNNETPDESSREFLRQERIASRHVFQRTSDGASTRIDLLAEDFATGVLPVGWQNTVLGDPDYAWVFTPGFAFIDSDGAGEGHHLAASLTTPAISCISADEVYLQLSHWFYRGSGAWINDGKIQVSTDGLNWADAYVFQYDQGSSDYPTIQYDLSLWASNQPVVYIRFVYDDLGNWAYFWDINSVRVTDTDETDPPPPGILWSQMNLAGSGAASSQEFEPAYSNYTCQGADDFIVTDGPWTIGIVKFHGVYWNGTGPADAINIFFYSNNNGQPGNLLTSLSNLPYTNDNGLFSVSLPNPAPTFSNGQYWISIQGRMDYTIGGQFGWNRNALPQIENELYWQNPGGGFGPTTWTPGSTQWPHILERDFAFQLEAPPVDPDLTVIPPLVDFGTTALNSSKMREMTLTNTGGGSLQVSSISLSVAGNVFSLTGLPAIPFTLASGISQTFYINYSPSTNQEDFCNIVVSDDRTITEIPLTGIGGIFGENFDGLAFPPNNWSVTQLGTGNVWVRFSPGALNTGGGAFQDYNSENNVNSWLVSQQISVPIINDGGLLLNFFERNSWMDWYGFSGVYISSGNGTPGHADFEMIYESSEAHDSWTETTLDVTQYAGETIYVAFVYSGLDAHSWWIDQVEMYSAAFHTLTILDPMGPGDVWPEPGVYNIAEGSVVDLLASPILSFQGWTTGEVEDATSLVTTITMYQDQIVQAAFSYQHDLLWHQFNVGNDAVSSVLDSASGVNYEVADNFSGLEAEVSKIVVHGISLTHDGTGWVEWTPGPTEPFTVNFYSGPSNPPNWSNPLYTEAIVGEMTYIDQVWAISEGWVSAKINVDAGAGGWFLLLSSLIGNDSVCYQHGADPDLIGYDVLLELWSPSQVTELAAPVVEIIVNANGNAVLSWEPIPEAQSYYIYSAENPVSEQWGAYISHQAETAFVDLDDSGQNMRFYKVVASTNQPPRLNDLSPAAR